MLNGHSNQLHAAAKPVWWKVVVGTLLAIAEIGALFGRATPMAGNKQQIAGMNAISVLLLLLGLWLIYSGTQPLRRRQKTVLNSNPDRSNSGPAA